MAENRAKFNEFLAPGLFGVAADSFGAIPQGWKPIYDRVTGSKRAYEEMVQYTGLGHVPEKPEGTPIAYDERAQGQKQTLTHLTYAMGITITREAIEDDQYAVMKKGARELSRSAAATRARLRNEPLMTGDTPAVYTAADGLALFHLAHLRIAGGTYSNLHPVAADFTEAAVQAAILNYESLTDDRGKIVERRATGIMIGPALHFKATKVLGSRQEPGTANNAINPLYDRDLTLHMNHGITDKRWFIFGEKEPDTGLIGFDRIKATMARHGDFETGDAKFSVRFRQSQGMGSCKSIYMVPGI